MTFKDVIDVINVIAKNVSRGRKSFFSLTRFISFEYFIARFTYFKIIWI